MPGISWVEAGRWPLWENLPFALPSGIECRKREDVAVLLKSGTDKMVAFVPSRFDPNQLPSLLARLN